ncbi:MAG TPA: hypothetical protein V6D15_23815 [Oculatellaceae cyanobacterium]
MKKNLSIEIDVSGSNITSVGGNSRARFASGDATRSQSIAQSEWIAVSSQFVAAI